ASSVSDVVGCPSFGGVLEALAIPPVTGDNVSALAFCDVDGDGIQEMICGTE
ncbi:unnamed protein product, partial [Prorocentrum cordatum]